MSQPTGTVTTPGRDVSNPYRWMTGKIVRVVPRHGGPSFKYFRIINIKFPATSGKGVKIDRSTVVLKRYDMSGVQQPELEMYSLAALINDIDDGILEVKDVSDVQVQLSVGRSDHDRSRPSIDDAIGYCPEYKEAEAQPA